MKTIIRIVRKTHRCLYLASVLVFFILLYPFLAYYARDPERYFHQIVRCRRVLGLLSSAVVGVFYRFRMQAPIDWSRPMILCANHTSNLDITALVLLCPADFSFMGKIELLRNPVTAMFFKTIDIPIDRKSKLSAFRAFKRADNYLRKGRSMAIFPEGHIGEEYPPQLYDFKNGPFKLAIETQVAIVPIVIHNAWKIFWDEASTYGSRPGIIHIDVLKPVETDGFKPEQADELRNMVHTRIKNRWAP